MKNYLFKSSSLKRHSYKFIFSFLLVFSLLIILTFTSFKLSSNNDFNNSNNNDFDIHVSDKVLRLNKLISSESEGKNEDVDNKLALNNNKLMLAKVLFDREQSNTIMQSLNPFTNDNKGTSSSSTNSTTTINTDDILTTFNTTFVTRNEFNQLIGDVNGAWTIIATALVFFMKAGFAYLEAGSIRKKSIDEILLKNLVDACCGILVYFLIGFGISYGDDPTLKTRNSFLGNSEFLLTKRASDTTSFNNWTFFIFQWAFSAIASTIVSGAVGERCMFHAYLIYNVVIGNWIYACVTHWFWSTTGFLSPFNDSSKTGLYRIGSIGVLDFAGCGPVHMTGGIAACLAAYVLGPRPGRFERPHLYAEGNSSLTVMGTFILWFGWFGFNCGSTMAVYGYGQLLGKIATTTMLSSASGSVSCLLFGYVFTRKLELIWCMNGLLAGCVSITSGCSVVEPYAAIIIGFVGSCFYVVGSKLVYAAKIDDPVDATAVHGFCGFWGLLTVGIFSTKEGIKSTYGLTTNPTTWGFFHGGSFEQLGMQLLGAILILFWTTINSLLLFFSIKYIIGFRKLPDSEDAKVLMEIEEELKMSKNGKELKPLLFSNTADNSGGGGQQQEDLELV